MPDSNAQVAIIESALLPTTMEAAIQFSERMALANLIPTHLQKRPADCLRVVLQAARWQMDPFSVADKTSVINNKLMYEGQLVSAVVNARGKLSKRLDYTFKGEGQTRVLTVSGTLQGEDEPRTIELTHALACKINKNGQMGINPDQQMTYIGARLWARRHTPELMLGVYVPDEMEDPPASGAEPEKNVTGTASAEPAAPPRADPGKLRRGRSGPSASNGPVVEGQIEPSPANPPAEPPAPAAETVAPRTTIEKKEEIKGVVVKVLESVYENFGDDANPVHGAKAKVEGGWSGSVYDLSGGHGAIVGGDGVKPAGILPIWQAGNVLRMDLIGRYSKAQKIVIAVTSNLTVVQPTEAKQGGLGLE